MVTVRFSMGSIQNRANEQTIARMLSSSGANVQTVTAGRVTCTTMVPPRSMMEYGFDSMLQDQSGQERSRGAGETRDRNAIIPVTVLRQLVTLAGNRFNRNGH
jgi:hypothetical protein